MLSKRGSRRKLLNIAGVPTWEEWYGDFEKRLHLDISFRTIQRWLKQYREAEMEEPPAPDANALAKQSVRQIESKTQAEKLECRGEAAEEARPCEPCQPHPRPQSRRGNKAHANRQAEKGFTPPVTETGKALPFTQAEITKAAKEQAAYWRKEGFPFHDKSETERGGNFICCSISTTPA